MIAIVEQGVFTQSHEHALESETVPTPELGVLFVIPIEIQFHLIYIVYISSQTPGRIRSGNQPLPPLQPFEVGPGQLLFFKKMTVHGIPEVLEEPFVVLSVDTPRRDPRDIVFVNSEEGTPDSFIADLSEL